MKHAEREGVNTRAVAEHAACVRQSLVAVLPGNVGFRYVAAAIGLDREDGGLVAGHIDQSVGKHR